MAVKFVGHVGPELSIEHFQLLIEIVRNHIEGYGWKCPTCEQETVEVNWRTTPGNIEIVIRCSSDVCASYSAHQGLVGWIPIYWGNVSLTGS